MTDTTIKIPPSEADQTLMKNADFMEWIAELEAVIREWDAAHGDFSPYTLPLVECCGLECWRGYYDDEYSPADAFAEDMTCWDREDTP